MGIVNNAKFGVIGLISAAAGVSQIDKSMNYVEVDAVVTKAAIDCFIKSGNESVVKKDTDKLAYMDCDMAPFAAKEYGFKETDISRRTTFSYSYVSPVDGSKHKGEHTKEYAAYKVGQKVKLYAHKEDPAKMRW